MFVEDDEFSAESGAELFNFRYRVHHDLVGQTLCIKCRDLSDKRELEFWVYCTVPGCLFKHNGKEYCISEPLKRASPMDQPFDDCVMDCYRFIILLLKLKDEVGSTAFKK